MLLSPHFCGVMGAGDKGGTSAQQAAGGVIFLKETPPRETLCMKIVRLI